MKDRPHPEKITRGLSTKSDKIRALADAGYSRSEIARQLDIRYQHVRNVLVARQSPTNEKLSRQSRTNEKLFVKMLSEAGFEAAGQWVRDEDGIRVEGHLHTGPAVYAFAVGSRVVYIGKTSRSFRQRMGQYRKPGPTQSTNQRIRPLIREELNAGNDVEVLAANPGETDWRGLPVDLVTGLEAALVRHFRPPWNQQGTKS